MDTIFYNDEKFVLACNDNGREIILKSDNYILP